MASPFENVDYASGWPERLVRVRHQHASRRVSHADVHTVGRNASATAPAKFLVLLVKDANKPARIPVAPK